ncbi:MAG: VWA domain-containing protein [Candidatus Brocadiae bacterium]|nr:VWA domain-containing protein [Candidatus Brocadiia bacterium]
MADSRRKGQIFILFAMVVITLVMVCMLAVDVGRIVTAQAELQNAVDAAALAGTSQLLAFGSLQEAERQAATAEAKALAEANTVAGEPLTLQPDIDIAFGCYVEATRSFKPEWDFTGSEIIDSVMVQGRRTHDAPDGAIDLFFASLFGIQATSQTVRAVGTKPRRYVMFTMDRSGSMCYDTTNIDHRYEPNADGSMAKSPSGWYWMPRYIYTDNWYTAWFYAKHDATGDFATAFLPDHIQSRLYGGIYFRYCSKDLPNNVQSGWLYAPSYVTIYSYYGPDYLSWHSQSYGPIGSCDYAMANDSVQPIGASQDAMTAFVDLLNAERDRAGLVSYGQYSTLDHELTWDWQSLKDKVVEYDPRHATATPDGMETANDELLLSGRASGFGQKIIVLLTDGMANMVHGTNYGNPGSKINVEFFGEWVQCRIYQTVVDAIEAETRRARDKGVRIYTVSFGAGADQDLMPLIAKRTHAAYYYAEDHETLTDIFLDIFHHLPPILTK